MTAKEILNASFIEVIKESLISDSSFYAQISLKHNDNLEIQNEQLALSQKYNDALEWFISLIIDSNKSE